VNNETNQLAQLKLIHGRDGVRAMLIYLNGLTEHRYTALYRFDLERLKNVYFFDRETPAQESCAEIPIMASYCMFVRSTDRKFVTMDSTGDERLFGHPKRLEVQSYCGVPLIGEDGRAFGTICHFDHLAIPISDRTVSLMEAVAPLLSVGLGRAAPNKPR
jgi:GAF domain-containing protein